MVDEYLLVGWIKGSDQHNGKDVWTNNERQMMIFTSDEDSVLVKDEKAFKSVKGNNHFNETVKLSDVIWAKHFAKLH